MRDAGYETFEDVGARTRGAIQRLAELAVREEQSRSESLEKERPASSRDSGPGIVPAVLVITHGDVCLAARLWASNRPFTPEERERSQATDYPGHCAVTALTIETKTGECVAYECFGGW